MNSKLLFIAIFLVCSGYVSIAQCELDENEQACVDVNLSLGADCMGELIPEMVIPALDTMDEECAEDYEITIFGGNGEEIPNEFDMDDLHKTYHYLIENDDFDYACSGKVTVEYKLDPVLICDPDTMFSCFTLEAYQGPLAEEDNCVDVIVRVIDEQINKMECDPEGGDTIAIITRIYLAINEHGLISDSCEQEIALRRFNIEEEIDWPDDMTLYDDDGCLEIPTPEESGVPKTKMGVDGLMEQICLYPVPNSLCNIKIDYEDLITNKKNCRIEIIREWTAYEWYCGEEFMETHLQTFEYMDNTAPEVECDFGPIVAYTEQDQCYAVVELPEIISQDTCNGIGKVDIKFPGGFIGNVMGDTVAHIPVGEHIVTYRVYDVCHNMTSCDVMVTVLDTIQPLSLCKGPMAVDMENQMTIELQAEDFNLWSLDNCMIDSFAVARMENNCNMPEDLFFNEDVLFCCQDTGQVIMVVMRTIDTSGNYSQCMVPVTVENGDRPPMLTSEISGFVYSQNGEMIESADVFLNGDHTDLVTTDPDGQFLFSSVPQEGNYELEVHKNDQFLNGVSTLDLLIIQRHILGSKILEDPYSKVAADVNGDRTISIADIIELRELILGRRTTLGEKESWTFVQAGYEFQEQRSAFIDDFPTHYKIEQLGGDVEVNFIGVKTGDVNGDAKPDLAAPGIPEIRQNQIALLEYTPRGNYITVSLKSTFSGVLKGFQFALDHPDWKLISFSTGKADLNSSNFSENTRGKTSISWHTQKQVRVEADDVLMRLVFMASQKAGHSENLLKINRSMISPEVYLGEELQAFALKIVNSGDFEKQFPLFVEGIQPNPWSETCRIRLIVPADGMFQLRITDALGRGIYKDAVWLNKGQNYYELSREFLPNAGVYYVEMNFKHHRVMRKIFIIE